MGRGLFGGLSLLLAGVLCSTALAEDARVLPAGRSRFGANFARTGDISKTFNSFGERKGITDPYNLRLEGESLAAASPDISQAYHLLDQVFRLYYDPSQAKNPYTAGVTTQNTGIRLSDHLSKGDLGVRADAQRSQTSLQFQHGLTDRLSVGFMVPIIKTRVRTRIQLTDSPKIAHLRNVMSGYAETQEMRDLYSGLAYLDDANLETLQGILQSAGYQRFGDSETSGIGDVVFGGRYNYLKTKRETWINSAQAGLSAPTGRLRDFSNVTSVDNGQGCWDIALAHIANFTPRELGSRWMFSHGLHYTHRLPGSRLYRVKNDPDDFIPPASGDERIRMQLGDKIWTTLGAKWAIDSNFSVESSYEWYWKMKDYFQGDRPRDYSYLSEDTNLYLETFNLGGSFSTIDLFLKKRFPIPLDFSINYFHPIQGKNAVIAPFTMAEVAMYF